jgi:AcrR family transcriptional regulator
MADPAPPLSPRHAELLEAAYRYALEHGLADLSLRPLAAAIDSSPRVLLFLFGSKDGLVRALLARARTDELALIDQVGDRAAGNDLGVVAWATWAWLAASEHRPLLTLWAEAYARSLTEPDGPWAGFARQTVDDWLAVLARSQPPRRRHTLAGTTERTLTLAVLRGALLDLLATGDVARTSQAVRHYVSAIDPRRRPGSQG